MSWYNLKEKIEKLRIDLKYHRHCGDCQDVIAEEQLLMPFWEERLCQKCALKRVKKGCGK